MSEFSTSSDQEARVGIERAFDVIRNPAIHTKGYVMTALELIEEYGDEQDKTLLAKLMQKNNNTHTKRKNTKQK